VVYVYQTAGQKRFTAPLWDDGEHIQAEFYLQSFLCSMPSCTPAFQPPEATIAVPTDRSTDPGLAAPRADDRPAALEPGLETLLTRLIDALDDRAADVFDERLRQTPPTPERLRRTGAAVVLGSLALGVAATAVSAGNLLVALLIWPAIAVVNIAHARRR
jgi:hypothetical protein